jgi:hypothetical protein
MSDGGNRRRAGREKDIKDTHPQMTQMDADEGSDGPSVFHPSFLLSICAHLRHLRMRSLPKISFSGERPRENRRGLEPGV